MCGCVGPDEFAAVKSAAEITAYSAAPAGTAISLLVSMFALRGPRRWLAWAMALLTACFLAFHFFDETLALSFGGEQLAFVVYWATFLFLGLVSLVYWPVTSRWVNLPLVAGVGITLLAAVTHLVLATWGKWIVMAAN